jgi:hypothetical protein
MKASEAREKTTEYIGRTETASMIFVEIGTAIHKGQYNLRLESEEEYFKLYGISQMLKDLGYEVNIETGHGKSVINVRW